MKLIAGELPTKNYHQVEKYTKKYLHQLDDNEDNFEKENERVSTACYFLINFF